MPRRLKLTITYDGTDFHGWQVQPGLPTIQGTLEDILLGIEKKPVHVAGSGRTDAGVHALAQIGAITLDNPIPCDNLKRAINRLLPAAIRILRVEESHPEFNPRYDAIAKTYEYRIHREEICPPFDRRYVHHHPYPLDEHRMIELAQLFTGEHDFTAFAAADDRDALGRSKVRTIFSSVLHRDGARLIYRVTGSGFLKHMVRNIVGTLLEVGKHNCDRGQLIHLLSGAATAKAGATAPPNGLFLIDVEYKT